MTTETYEILKKVVEYSARKYATPDYPYEDLVQEGWLKVLTNVEKFDNKRGIKITTYVNTLVKQHFNEIYRKSKKTVQIEQLKYNTNSKSANFGELLHINNPAVDYNTTIDYINYPGLNKLQSKILTYIKKGYTYRQIGRKLDISCGAISNHLKDIRNIVTKPL